MMIMTVLFRGKRLSDYDLTEEQVDTVAKVQRIYSGVRFLS